MDSNDREGIFFWLIIIFTLKLIWDLAVFGIQAAWFLVRFVTLYIWEVVRAFNSRDNRSGR